MLGDCVNLKSKYLSNASLLLLTSIFVKIISATYKIPLTSYIGAVGRGYFASAYNLFLPINVIVMGALPISLSRLVSKYDATSNTAMLLSIRKASRQLFSVVGFGGMAIMLLVAKPYSTLIASSPKSIYTIIILVPCILFSSLGASYEDYYEGLLNMKPTSVSQSLDAVFKMVFGLVFARYSMVYLYNAYLQTGMVLGVKANTNAQALSLIYPFTSASAMLGVALGSFASLCYVFAYDKIHFKNNHSYDVLDVKSARKELLSFAFPVLISCAVQSLFQFLDTAVVQYSLGRIEQSVLMNTYGEAIALSGVEMNDLPTYVYGLFSTALDFKNLVPGITMALGVCAVPALSRAYETKDNDQLSLLINSIYKYTAIISLFGGVALMLCSKDILTLFFKGSYDIVVGCDNLVKGFGATVVLYSLSAVAVFSVQAIGMPEKSIKPYVVSGIIRVVLNYTLVQDERFLLMGVVISGAVGYSVMFVWNVVIVVKNAKIKLDLANIMIKPIIVFVVTIFLSTKTYEMFDFSSLTIFYLLLKIVILSTIFCILCFSLKLLKIKDIFLQK